jgi:hypothetical protein
MQDSGGIYGVTKSQSHGQHCFYMDYRPENETRTRNVGEIGLIRFFRAFLSP